MAEPTGDERLAYRGLFSRLLVRPDIGALIGLAVIWVFFWAVSVPFGTANGATSVLDVSSMLGIMAVAVAVLMIGGEFDLSSGANTGAMGILVILLVKETGDIGGLGLHYWFAIPLSLAAALGIGWVNGWMVERLALPSFIATLATFFVLKGAKLGFSKRIVDQIQVGRADEGSGYERWRQIFASEWKRNDHLFEARDLIYLVLIVAGLSLVALAVFEFSFRVRQGSNGLGVSGLAMLVLGCSGALAWFEWSRKDHSAIEGLEDRWTGFALFDDPIEFLGPVGDVITWTSGFYLGVLVAVGFLIHRLVGGASFATIVHMIGALVAVVGMEAAIRRRPVVLIGVIVVFVVLGAVTLVMHQMREESGEDSDAKRPTIGLVVSLLGMAAVAFGIRGMHTSTGMDWDMGIIIAVGALMGMLGFATWRYEKGPGIGALSLNSEVAIALIAGAISLALGIVAVLVLDSSANSQIGFFFTEQGLRAMLFGGFVAAGLVALLIGVARAGRISPLTKTVALSITALAVVLIAFVIRSEADAAKFRAEWFGVMLVVALLMFGWALTGLFFEERRFLDVAADGTARWIGLLGVGAATTGLVVKLLYTMNYEFTRATPITPAILSVRILWFFGFTAVLTWVLTRSRWGSWVYAVGGNKQASRQVGVPAARTKTQLFMLVAFAAWLVGMLLAFRLNTIQASTGDGLEFEYIIAAVVGGTFLTGGYGSVMGAALGAGIMAISRQGIPFSGWNSDWRFVFLGLILLLAVVANGFIRSKAEAVR